MLWLHHSLYFLWNVWIWYIVVLRMRIQFAMLLNWYWCCSLHQFLFCWRFLKHLAQADLIRNGYLWNSKHLRLCLYLLHFHRLPSATVLIKVLSVIVLSFTHSLYRLSGTNTFSNVSCFLFSLYQFLHSASIATIIQIYSFY